MLLREKDLSLKLLRDSGQRLPGDPALSIRKALVNPYPPILSSSFIPTFPAPTRVCLGCGGDFHPGGRRQCPAYTLTCRTCNRVGHLARVCQSGQRPAALSQPSTTPDIKTTPMYNHIGTCPHYHHPCFISQCMAVPALIFCLSRFRRASNSTDSSVLVLILEAKYY